MKRYSLLLFILLLTACLSSSGTPPIIESSPASESISAPTAENTPIPTVTPTSTEIPVEALPVDEIVQKYLTGEITSISNLTLEQQNAVRAEIAELYKKNGSLVHVTFNNEAYINPETFIMTQLGDGKKKEEQSINTIAQVELDEEGNVWIITPAGEKIKIENSANFDWNAVITDQNDTRMNWPTTQPGNSGLPDAQWFLTLESQTAYTPTAIATVQFGTFFLKEKSGGLMVETIPVYKIITDNHGNPIAARLILLSPAGAMDYLREGTDQTGGAIRTIFKKSKSTSEFINQGTIIWLGIEINQENIVDNPNPTSGYQGIISETDSGHIMIGEKEDSEGLLLIFARMLIAH